MELSETATARPRPRIESLSDMIFGLALSVGAITLVGNPPQTQGQLYTDLTTFGFSFLIVIQIWMRYTKIMSVLPLESGRTIFLNIVLLFCVSIEPFLFHILTSGIENAVSVVYAIDLGALNIIMGSFTFVLADEDRKLIAPDLIKQFRIDGMFTFIAAVMFLVSTLPVFWTTTGIGGIPLRYDLWIFPLIVVWVRRRLPQRKKS
jgi:uncharacterized membrane protein